jgi:hypothetical protein
MHAVCWVVLETIFCRAFTLCVTACDQIQNLKIFLPNPQNPGREERGPQTDKQLPQSPFAGYITFEDEELLHALL